MFAEFASNAVLAKARAKYGRRLTPQNYRDLINLTGVADVAVYLKTRTHYAEILRSVQESTVHRSNLEKLLRAHLLTELYELCSFERSVGEHLFEYVLLNEEINELLDFLRCLMAGRPEDYVLAESEAMNAHMEIDLLKLPGVRSYGELVALLGRRSELRRILENFRPQEGEPLDFPMLEATLDQYLYAFISDTFRRCFHGETYRALMRQLGLMAELSNLRRIIRAKRYYTATPELLQAQIIRQSRYLNRKQTAQLLEAPTADDAVRILGTTAYRKQLARHDFNYVDDFAARVNFEECRRAIRFSTHPAVVMNSYLLLAGVEIDNVTNIIEGVRYGIGPEAIAELLIQ